MSTVGKDNQGRLPGVRKAKPAVDHHQSHHDHQYLNDHHNQYGSHGHHYPHALDMAAETPSRDATGSAHISASDTAFACVNADDRANTSARGGILIRGGNCADGLNYQCSRSPPSPRKCVEMGHPACVSFENTTSTMNIRMRTDCEQNNICAHHLCRAMPPWYTIAHIRLWLKSQAHNCFPNPQSTWSTMWRSILSTMHHLSRFETSATLE